MSEKSKGHGVISGIFLIATLCSFFVSATGCAHGAHWVADNGEKVKQCDLPLLIGLDRSVTIWDAGAISDGIEYWNDIAGKRVFMFVGVLDFETPEEGLPGIVVIDSSDEYTRTSCAHTTLRWDQETGCMTKVIVHLNQACLNRHEPNYIETLVRHELGHVMGLRHNLDKGGLMYPKLQDKATHPVNISNQEMQSFMELYGEKKD